MRPAREKVARPARSSMPEQSAVTARQAPGCGAGGGGALRSSTPAPCPKGGVLRPGTWQPGSDQQWQEALAQALGDAGGVTAGPLPPEAQVSGTNTTTCAGHTVEARDVSRARLLLCFPHALALLTCGSTSSRCPRRGPQARMPGPHPHLPPSPTYSLRYGPPASLLFLQHR